MSKLDTKLDTSDPGVRNEIRDIINAIRWAYEVSPEALTARDLLTHLEATAFPGLPVMDILVNKRRFAFLGRAFTKPEKDADGWHENKELAWRFLALIGRPKKDTIINAMQVEIDAERSERVERFSFD